MGKIATTYNKSNDMVSAKFKSSLLENKIMAVGLTRIENDENDNLEAKLYPGELQKIFSDKAHIYRDLKKVAKRIVGHVIVLEDGKGNFKTFSMIPNAEYENGVFTLKFNQALKNHILGMEDHFTKLNLRMMTSFENVNAFRLYELFKSEYYRANKDGNLDLEYNLSELKFIIGIANSDNEAHKNRLSEMQNNIDWDKLLDALDKKDKKYANWADFKRGVLDPAQQELEEKADISFEYEEGLKKGKKVISIIFHLHKNNPSVVEIEDIKADFNEGKSKTYQYEMPRDLPQFAYVYENYVGHNDLTPEDIDLLITTADMNDKLVVAAIDAADKQEYVRNYMGWIIKYIKSGGYEEIPVLNGDRERTKQIIAIEEHYQQNIDEIATRVWNKTKTKPDIADFLASLNFSSLEDFELIYDDPQESYEMYIDWKKANK